MLTEKKRERVKYTSNRFEEKRGKKEEEKEKQTDIRNFTQEFVIYSNTFHKRRKVTVRKGM
jgi:hypothetical protein